MAYCTQTDLIDRFGEAMLIGLTDRGTYATGAIVTAVVSSALADADALIDGYIGVRYALPLAEVPPVLMPIARAIAIYLLHPSETSEKIRKDYDDALKQLRDISTGAIRLPVAGVEPDVTGGTGVQVTDRERPMEASKMEGFI